MAATKPLPIKLEAVLIRLGKAASLNVTQAVKLPYVVDVVANHILGKPITEGHHEAWENGVVTREVWHFLTKCEDSDLFHLEPVPWSEERKMVIDTEEVSGVLTPEEEHVVDFVAREFSSIRAGELGRFTKLMNPGIARWGSNRRASLGQDAFDHLSDDYQEMAEAVSTLTLDELARDSVPVDDIEEALA